MIEVKRILCPVDFSEFSRHALHHAIALGQWFESEVTAHAIEVPPEFREHVLITGDFDVDAVRAAAEAACFRRLRELIPDSVRTYCGVETVVREGAAYRQILQLAAERKIDLIVMGVQGRGAVDLALFGSQTAHVVRAATCPILIVRHQ